MARISVSIQRKSRGKTFYFDGYKWSSSSTKTAPDFWFLAKLIGNRWKFEYVPNRSVSVDGHGTPYDGPQLISGAYVFQITAYDRSGNKRSVWRSVRVKADAIRPSVAFSQRQHVRMFSSFHSIHGVARDKGGSGIASVFYAITRQKDGKSWDGSHWNNPYGPSGNPPIWLPAILSKGQWQLDGNLPSGTALPSGLYRVEVYAADRAGNESYREFVGPRKDSDVGAGEFQYYPLVATVKVK